MMCCCVPVKAHKAAATDVFLLPNKISVFVCSGKRTVLNTQRFLLDYVTHINVNFTSHYTAGQWGKSTETG